MQGASTALGTIGALFQGQASATNARIKGEADARTLEARADADAFNAKVYRQLAESETQRAAAEAGDYRRTQGAKAATMRAIQADSGFVLEGSPLFVNESILQEIEFGSSRIAYGGQLASTRARNQATLLDVSSRNNRTSAQFARAAGEVSADNITRASYLNSAGNLIKGSTGIYETLAGGRTPAGSSSNNWWPSASSNDLPSTVQWPY